MTGSPSTIQFLGDWRHEQRGTIQRGSRLTLDYDKARLLGSFAPWQGAEFGDIVALCRFHPRGDIVSGSVVAPVRDRENPPGIVISHVPQPLDLPVPPDATHAEIWFHGFYQTSTRKDGWDSRFGENYWFEISGPPPRVPTRPVSYRSGAVTRPDVVNVLEHRATKVNAFPAPQGGGSPRDTNLQTSLAVLAWVRESPYGANAWIDAHIFDDRDELIHAETLTLSYRGLAGAFSYEFGGVVYQGATATLRSVEPRPDARTLQYRLYYELNYHVFTDGILHQFELAEDALVRS
jgi:Family of unknown function (DUF6209)